MNSLTPKIRRFVLASRPDGLPALENFRLEETELPGLKDGQVLVRNFLISVDPGMRARLSDTATYAAPIAIGEPVEGASVGVVLETAHPNYAKGDVVAGGLGWQEAAVADGRFLRPVKEKRLPYSTAIGILGIPGMTAYFGVKTVGKANPGETVLVTSAAGAVGSAAGQIAKLLGCKAIGIAGGTAKCAWVRDELGFDAVIDYRAETDLPAAVGNAAPQGIDVYFDNVGNAMLDPLIPLIRPYGRIAVSGQVADYNTPAAARAGLKNTDHFIFRRLRMEGFVVFDFLRDIPQASTDMTQWILNGQLKYREEILDGFERLPEAFIGLFKGENFGRRLVRTGPDPA